MNEDVEAALMRAGSQIARLTKTVVDLKGDHERCKDRVCQLLKIIEDAQLKRLAGFQHYKRKNENNTDNE